MTAEYMATITTIIDETCDRTLCVRMAASGITGNKTEVEMRCTSTDERIWKGSMLDLALIVDSHLEKDMPMHRDTEKTVGPIPDNGNPFETLEATPCG